MAFNLSDKVTPTRAFVLSCLAVSMLAACGGGGNGGESSVASAGASLRDAGTPSVTGEEIPDPDTAPPAPAPIPRAPVPAPPHPAPAPVQGGSTLTLSGVELAQTHVVPPEGRQMQSPNDVTNHRFKTLTLIGQRSALLMLVPSGGSGAPQVRATLAGGRELGPLTMDDPSKLPGTDGGNRKYSTTHYSATLPAEWVQPGTVLQVSRTGTNTVSVPLTVSRPVAAVLRTWPLFLYGARPDTSRAIHDMAAASTAGVSWDREYLQRMPFSSFMPRTAGTMEFGLFPTQPANDENNCRPAVAFQNREQMQTTAGHDGFYVMNQALRWGEVLRTTATANHEDTMHVGYWMPLELLVNGQQITNQGGGLATTGVMRGSGSSDDFAGTFFHELGHGWGVSHTAGMYNDGDYPYVNGSQAGSAWAYDADRKLFLSPLRDANATTCRGTLAGDGLCYKNDPMNSGQSPLDDKQFKWGTFSDYSMAIMQNTTHVRMNAQYDPAFPGRVKQWDEATRSFVAYRNDTRWQALYTQMQWDQRVVSILGSVSHFNVTPDASRIFIGKPGTGNLPRLFDPALQSDMDYLKNNVHRANNSNYCTTDNGCDYTLQITFADHSVKRVLLPVGHSPSNASAANIAATKNPLAGASFARYAVNLPASGSAIVGVKLFNTPLGRNPSYTAIDASLLGTPTYPLMNQWTTADGVMGGAGGLAGAGTPVAPDLSQCQASARPYVPAS